MLSDPDQRFFLEAGLLPHEFVHSWNGKYRRPTGLATRNYQEPMIGDLLWVYEGLTEYLGEVLTARTAYGLRNSIANPWPKPRQCSNTAQAAPGVPSKTQRAQCRFYARKDQSGRTGGAALTTILKEPWSGWK